MILYLAAMPLAGGKWRLAIRFALTGPSKRQAIILIRLNGLAATGWITAMACMKMMCFIPHVFERFLI